MLSKDYLPLKLHQLRAVGLSSLSSTSKHLMGTSFTGNNFGNCLFTTDLASLMLRNLSISSKPFDTVELNRGINRGIIPLWWLLRWSGWLLVMIVLVWWIMDAVGCRELHRLHDHQTTFVCTWSTWHLYHVFHRTKVGRWYCVRVVKTYTRQERCATLQGEITLMNNLSCCSVVATDKPKIESIVTELAPH